MSLSGGLSGAASGASMGSAFGPWGTAIGAGVGAISGIISSKSADKSAAKAIKQQAEFLRREMARSQAEIRRQRTMEILNTANAIQYIQRSSGQVKADISVQNATADAIGASAAAAQIDAQRQEDRSKAEAIRTLEYNIANQSQSLDSQLGQSKSSTMAMLEASKQNRTSKSDSINSLISLGATFGSAWAGGAFSGAGKASKGALKGGSNTSLSGGYGLSKQSVSGLRYGG